MSIFRQRVRGLRAAVFDLDGTLVASPYDWPAIRRELGIHGDSLIDELNARDPAARRAGWARLEEREAEATRGAKIIAGAREVLDFLRHRGMALALVTNNSETNAQALLRRFALRFDVVLTRDSGLWKPSGESLLEALRRLGRRPEESMMVGDTRWDLQAAREAGCALAVMLGPAARDLPADLILEGPAALLGELERAFGSA
ncbi:MAG: HAD family hydrolase [Acidobacteriota bacterium]|nr:HAD family hydrolase [Acidobacteriota bacterium]MDQ7086960.1 HAD family hydrolase [Acidobacteriota bacterium]